jgi:hypothetical protein
LLQLIVMAMAVAHLHFMHPLVSLWSALHQRLVLVSSKLRQLPQECHDVPKKLIVVHHAPGWHAAHLYPVFHDPELFRRCELAFAASHTSKCSTKRPASSKSSAGIRWPCDRSKVFMVELPSAMTFVSR